MKHKHLTYDDRLIIQQELENNYSLHMTLHRADVLEAYLNGQDNQVKTSASHTALCARVNVCAMVNLCTADCSRTSCANCAEACHSARCPDYQPRYCTRLTKAPHCCNGCPQ